MKTYDIYKDSSIQWIGKIPEHWEVKKLKYVAKVVLGKMLTPENKGDYVLKPYLRAQNLQWLNVDVSDVKEMWFSKNELKSFRIKENDILVSEGGEVGRTCIWKNEIEECYFQNSVNSVTINEGEARFYLYQFYTLGTKDIFNSIVNKVSIAHLTKEKLREIPFVVPQLPEQTAIANYLDTKTTEIDQIITDKEALINLYEEEKKALINEAVTKGVTLSGVETSAAKLKPSGIDWLGDIPEHWEVKKLKYLAKICNGRDYREIQVEEGGYPVYGTGGIFNRCSEFIYNKTSVLLGRKGTVDRPIFVDEPFWTSDTIYYTEINKTVVPKFFYFLCLQIKFDLYIYGSAVPSMTKEYYDHIFFPLPPIEEQTAIVFHIETETTKINDKINLIKQEIELLKEYRQALIFEAVTGKIRVH